jgi:hypothetical protein
VVAGGMIGGVEGTKIYLIELIYIIPSGTDMEIVINFSIKPEGFLTEIL